MSSADLAEWLLVASIATSAAILLVAALRKPLRTRFGSGAVLALWCLPPLAMAGTMVPSSLRPREFVVDLIAWLPPTTAMPVHADAASSWSQLIIVFWIAGCVLSALLVLFTHLRLRRRLGRAVRRDDGCWRFPKVPDFGPAAVGLLRPRIVLPEDFEARYGDRQQALILAHERHHIARGDLWSALAAVVFRCVFWFNPLVHWALRRFVQDQELACDAAVIAAHPGCQRDYAEAMLQTALNPPTTLVRTWSDATALKERVRMLKQTPVTTRARRSGLAIATLMGLLSAAAAWALQPNHGRSVETDQPLHLVEMSLTLSGAETVTRTMALVTASGEWFSIADVEAGWQAEFRLYSDHGDHYDIQGRLKQGGNLIGEPRLIVETGVEAGIHVDGRYDLRLRVEPLSPDNDPRTTAALAAPSGR